MNLIVIFLATGDVSLSNNYSLGPNSFLLISKVILCEVEQPTNN